MADFGANGRFFSFRHVLIIMYRSSKSSRVHEHAPDGYFASAISQTQLNAVDDQHALGCGSYMLCTLAFRLLVHVCACTFLNHKTSSASALPQLAKLVSRFVTA